MTMKELGSSANLSPKSLVAGGRVLIVVDNDEGA
jgi:hypothetical protein